MLFWPRPDLFEQLDPDSVDLAAVRKFRSERSEKLERPYHAKQAETLQRLPTADELKGPVSSDLTAAHVTIGSEQDLTEDQHLLLEQAINALQPWRKGPFRLFGHEIDAEWRSNLKWERILPALGELRGRRILDVGCGNGYYMWRAAGLDPSMVIGIDPSVPFYLSFELMQRYLQMKSLQYDLLGVEHLEVFDRAFDVAMCMGIVYHHRNPIMILKNLLGTLRVGGLAIIESQTIPGDDTFALFPEERYAKARNVYFVPTKDCLINWARRAGFKNVELVDHTKVTIDEQRSTEFMAYESLKDFLHPDDDSKTIEGYPAPYRTVIRGERMYV